MALYATEYSENGGETPVILWHVGTPFPSDIAKFAMQKTTLELQADGDELEHIKRVFSLGGTYTIPMPQKRVVRWYGDIARTIIGNL